MSFLSFCDKNGIRILEEINLAIESIEEKISRHIYIPSCHVGIKKAHLTVLFICHSYNVDSTGKFNKSLFIYTRVTVLTWVSMFVKKLLGIPYSK